MIILNLKDINGKLPNKAMLIHAKTEKTKKPVEDLIDYLFLKLREPVKIPIKIVIIEENRKLLLFSL